MAGVKAEQTLSNINIFGNASWLGTEEKLYEHNCAVNTLNIKLPPTSAHFCLLADSVRMFTHQC